MFDWKFLVFLMCFVVLFVIAVGFYGARLKELRLEGSPQRVRAYTAVAVITSVVALAVVGVPALINVLKPSPASTAPGLWCNALTYKRSTDPRTPYKFHFTALAAWSGSPIKEYVFNFGDGSSYTIRSNRSFANLDHSYQPDKTYKAQVFVTSQTDQMVTSTGCTTTIQP